MHIQFLSKIKQYFPDHSPFDIQTTDNDYAYVVDNEPSVLLENKVDKAFEIQNIDSKAPISHIAIDKDFVTSHYYNHLTENQGRPDSLLFSETDIVFLELKMNVTSAVDDKRWKKIGEGMEQLKPFLLYFRNGFEVQNDKVSKYFPAQNIHAVISQSFYPRILPNSQRNKNLEKFKTETGLELKLVTTLKF